MKTSRMPGAAGVTLTPRFKRVLRDLGILAAVFGIGYLLAFVLLSPTSLFSSEHAAPRLLELPRAKAEQELADLGLRARVIGEVTHPTIPVGAVVSQDPPVGTVLPAGGTVQLTLSSGPPVATVPDVIGMVASQATAIVKAAGLRVGMVDSLPGAEREPGVVLGTRPSVGTARQPGDKVDLVVSRGP